MMSGGRFQSFYPSTTTSSENINSGRTVGTTVAPTIPTPVFLPTTIDVERFKCPLCYEVALDPVQTPCNHLFCRSCITTHLQSSYDGHPKNFCPIDRASISIHQLTNLPPSLCYTWNVIPISCPKCVQWKGTLKYYTNHLNICDATVTATPYTKDLEQRLNETELLWKENLREKDEIIRKQYDQVQEYVRHVEEQLKGHELLFNKKIRERDEIIRKQEEKVRYVEEQLKGHELLRNEKLRERDEIIRKHEEKVQHIEQRWKELVLLLNEKIRERDEVIRKQEAKARHIAQRWKEHGLLFETSCKWFYEQLYVKFKERRDRYLNEKTLKKDEITRKEHDEIIRRQHEEIHKMFQNFRETAAAVPKQRPGTLV
jgi:hypothetical protein